MTFQKIDGTLFSICVQYQAFAFNDPNSSDTDRNISNPNQTKDTLPSRSKRADI